MKCERTADAFLLYRLKPEEKPPFDVWWESLPESKCNNPDAFRVLRGSYIKKDAARTIWGACETAKKKGEEE